MIRQFSFSRLSECGPGGVVTPGPFLVTEGKWNEIAWGLILSNIGRGFFPIGPPVPNHKESLRMHC